jgi:hypothetical protein
MNDLNPARTITEMGLNNLEFIQDIQRLQRKFQSFRDENPGVFETINKFQKLAESLAPLMNIVRPVMEAQEAIRGYLDERIKLAKRIKVVSESGWYLPIWFIDSLKVKDLDGLFVNDSIEFERIVTELFEETLVETIQGRLLDQFPKRSPAIISVVSSHLRKDYFAAIPLALTLADGFCKDSFFIDRGGKQVPIGFFDLDKPKHSASTQKLKSAFAVEETSIFSLLTNQLADDDRNRHLVHEQNTKRPSQLNRHAIIHGESFDFGTYINSVKAILLLNFIADLALMSDVSRQTS